MPAFLPAMLSGLLCTLQISVLALALGITLGLLGAAVQYSKYEWLKRWEVIYTYFIRGIPDLILVLFFYFGGCLLLGEFFDPIFAGSIALGISFGAYASEVFQGAIESIPRGQLSAADAFGMERGKKFLRIIWPQFWVFALPGIGNLFLILLKESALVSVIGAEELMRQTQYAAQYTHQPFFYYSAATGFYLLLTTGSASILRHCEKRSEVWRCP